ncbi:MAG: glycine--tRNA ligase [Patescibacteria group bacterium]|nr:glycine--tRNA ligase [Patescibacteria group bacterium]MCL5224391.1 glycine--tRNA ligase [Patescibacteria group bacterium]
MATTESVSLMDKIVSLAKRRGFVFPSSEIYGGLANSYEYGPLGVELKKNIQDEWWNAFVRQRSDMVGLDSSIILHPKVWEASGHVAGFADAMVDCKNCKTRMRADHLIEEYFESKGEKVSVEGKSPAELERLIKDNKIPCPVCSKHDWTPVRKFNLLFETNIGIVPEAQSKVYLRGETAQGIFVSFKNILDSTRLSLPFGVGQLGKVFRNEITKGNFIFRTLEFEQGEIEYFFDPAVDDWQKLFESWKKNIWEFATNNLNVRAENLRWREHSDEERSFYSKRTEDLEYKFPFGFKELWGLAYRTDYDLQQHTKYSGIDLSYLDPVSGRKFIPHVIEPSVGINRLMAMVMLDSYREEGDRVVLQLKPGLAPYKAAVFPLLANKPQLVEVAQGIYRDLKKEMTVAWDDRGNIGKRYYAQDEIGTPYCVTVDFDSLENKDVTVRDRDTMKQDRVPIKELSRYIKEAVRPNSLH